MFKTEKDFSTHDTFVCKATRIAAETDKLTVCKETADAIRELLTVDESKAILFGEPDLERIFATDENGNIPDSGWGGGTLDTLLNRAEKFAGFDTENEDFFALASYSIRLKAPENLKEHYLRLLVNTFVDVVRWNTEN